MRVLVTWGSKRGGTAGIGRMLAEVLEARGFDVVAAPVDEVDDVADADAVVVGGALYANRWPSSARRFVTRHLEELRSVPVWFFSSGPLDDSAANDDIPAPVQVQVLMERVGAKGHVTFGGRLEADARGFPASAMAKEKAGDWRSPERVRSWAAELAAELPGALPGEALEHPARSVPRLVGHGFLGWALCGAVTAMLLQVTTFGIALVVRAVVAPLVFVGIAMKYFGAPGAREPLQTAVVWTGLVVALDVLVGGAVLRSLGTPAGFLITWLPAALIFVGTLITGVVVSAMPPKSDRSTTRAVS